ncbi:MAG: UDP-N-acetylmuramate--L-alanine ligase [Flavobacteriales bacterium]|nr:UDP-N-acetylmuramate--L-alanine ligase [Flavobacteriales bacterium]
MKGLDINSVFFVGIGGIGMSAIAFYMLSKNIQVYGYDRVSSKITKELESKGARIIYVDETEKIDQNFLDAGKERTTVIYTPAIPRDHNILSYFLDNGHEVVKRSDLLQRILKGFKILAVAGTHGKTTTSSILAHILNESIGCNAFLGGIANNFSSNYIENEESELAVVEADEFDRSFLKLDPHISLITSVEADHLDVYGEEETFIQVFQEFSELTSSNGMVVKCGSVPLIEKEGLSYVTYAYEEGENCVRNLRYKNHNSFFDLNIGPTNIQEVQFKLPGKYNALNALGASIVADRLGVEASQIKTALESFSGIKRRFEYHIQKDDLVYIDDYAHHPGELDACIGAVRDLYPEKKITVIFQPHLFSRTRDFMDGFARSLSKVDQLYLMDIYPAREIPIIGINSAVLLEKIELKKKQLVSKEDLINDVLERPHEVVLSLGAGDIDRMVEPLKKGLLSIHELIKEQDEKST